MIRSVRPFVHYRNLHRGLSFSAPKAKIEARRVVVTGIGCVTPLGNNPMALFEGLMEGKSGVIKLPSEKFGHLKCQIGATVDDFDPKSVVTNERQQGPRFISFALHAARDALKAAGLDFKDNGAGSARAGVAIGSGIGSLEDIEEAALALHGARGPRGISPFFVPRILANMAAGHVSMANNLLGPNHSVSTACATGAHAIGDAYRMIQRGDADVMLAGGTEASLNPLAMAGFARAKALSTKFNDEPERASRPFDDDRDGFVMGEGAAVLVLEELSMALARGAPVLAEVRGYGMSGDAHHITAPAPDGSGARRSMEAALLSAGIPLSAIGYVNAHATSTPMGDEIEARAIEAIIYGNDHAVVGSTKGSTGHLLGAAGAVEAAVTVMSVNQDRVPPSVNLDSARTPLLRYASKDHARHTVDAALSNSFGFGGTNATLCFAKVADPTM